MMDKIKSAMEQLEEKEIPCKVEQEDRNWKHKGKVKKETITIICIV